MEEKVFFEGELGKVCGILNIVDKTKEIVIIVHGFSAHKNTGPKFIAENLEEVGVNSLRIDLDNIGESQLNFETMVSIPNYTKQVKGAITFCKNKGFNEISLIGTSYGGLVVFATALKYPEIKRIVLRAPVVDYKEHALWLYGDKKLNEFKNKGFMPYYKTPEILFNVNFDFIEKSYPYSMYKNAQKIQIPTLIIQGDLDEQIECKGAEKVVKLFPNAKLHIIKGAGHDLGVNGDWSESQEVLKEFFKED